MTRLGLNDDDSLWLLIAETMKICTYEAIACGLVDEVPSWIQFSHELIEDLLMLD